MASEKVEVKVWVVVDQEGDYSVSREGAEAAGDQYQEEHGELTVRATRRIEITVVVPLPRPVQIAATLGEEQDVSEVSVS